MLARPLPESVAVMLRATVADMVVAALLFIVKDVIAGGTDSISRK